jgi:hypothetical protein
LPRQKRCARDVELKAAERRGDWGVDVDTSKIPPWVLNLCHYIALREQDLTDLQYRLAAQGLSSLGRSESHVTEALDALERNPFKLCRGLGVRRGHIRRR